MRRHELDLVSLVTGLVFVAIAASYLVAEYAGRDISAGWVLPLGLIGLGLAGLTGSVRRGLRPDPVPTPVVTHEVTHDIAREGYGRSDLQTDGGLDDRGTGSTGADGLDRRQGVDDQGARGVRPRGRRARAPR